MPPAQERRGSLKRGRAAPTDPAEREPKRRSKRISSRLAQPEEKNILKNGPLPSPVTHNVSDETIFPAIPQVADEILNSQVHQTPPPTPRQAIGSPFENTQIFSQFIYPPTGLATDVEDEEREGVWGYLIPLDHMAGDTMVLRRRGACPIPGERALVSGDGRQTVDEDTYEKQEERFEESKIIGYPAGGFLIGRHPECDRVLDIPTISNRHCLLFSENKAGDTIAILEDLSGNGTYVNDSIVGRNKRRELREGDEIAILDKARFCFRYPRSRNSSGFWQQYALQNQLGKGHFATVYLCVEKSSGMRYAVKKFEKRPGPKERSVLEGLQQEIGVLMGVSHPNVLCLKDTFDESDGVYLILELAAEGELFNYIVMKGKLSEAEARKVFIQLFQGIKYLHERNIVHRDIKPENILLIDKKLSVKLADFGLAKIIGEESFTTTLCGTPSYVAPEILESSNHRRYTRAVDVWSLGVVLYICLCGFPPFSDELCTAENPYNLAQQIKMGRFDYPSPYWDPVSDQALDLIDRMLTVDVDRRISIDECLRHPWTTHKPLDPNDSTDGLAGAMNELDFSKRKPYRERTLLSSLNEVHVSQVVPIHPEGDANDENNQVKIYQKNQGESARAQRQNDGKGEPKSKDREPRPAHERQPEEFMELGGNPDQPLFGDDEKSRYIPDQEVKIQW